MLKHGDVITITKYKIKYTVDDDLDDEATPELGATMDAGEGTIDTGEATIDTGEATIDAGETSGQRKMWRDTINSRSLSS